MGSLFHLLAFAIEAYLWLVMLPYAILSWFRLQPGTTLARIQYFLYQLVEPVLRPIRRVIRPMGGLDFSFLVVFLGAQLILIPLLLRT